MARFEIIAKQKVKAFDLPNWSQENQWKNIQTKKKGR